MQRVSAKERSDWKEQASSLGFNFHTMYGQPYWDESAYYRFSLRQIEDDLEDPSAEIESMCLQFVDRAVQDDELLHRLRIPEPVWDYVRNSWQRGDRNLYGRLDLAYDGTGPAKLLEYNADTPTSLYESAFFQWVWLEQAIERGIVPEGSDQYNSIQERLIAALAGIGIDGVLHCACCKDTDEDRGTVQYIEDCARQAGLETSFVFIEDIGIDPMNRFTDLDDYVIRNLFKLYPWEWLVDEHFGKYIPNSGVQFVEPVWKSVLSNKAMLPLLWGMFEGHPNLLPAYFEDDPRASVISDSYVRKPIFSREGSNVTLVEAGQPTIEVEGPYGEEGFILQQFHRLPQFDGNYTVVGSWLIASRPSGIGVREDDTLVTRDSSRFLPHIILD